jgi:hypothetical protein
MVQWLSFSTDPLYHRWSMTWCAGDDAGFIRLFVQTKILPFDLDDPFRGQAKSYFIILLTGGPISQGSV